MYEIKIKSTNIKIGQVKIGESNVSLQFNKLVGYKCLRKRIRNELSSADKKESNSISFSILSYVKEGNDFQKISKIFAEEILGFLREQTNLKEIILTMKEGDTLEIFKETFSRHIDYVQKKTYRNPIPTVDIIIEIRDCIVLIKRKNPPFGWAIPGGFVEYGESLEETAYREAKEETGLEVTDLKQLHTYSEPERDPRYHTVSTVFIANGKGRLKAGTDADDVRLFDLKKIPKNLVFDHGKILDDYLNHKKEIR